MTVYSYRIDPRPPELGGGWRLFLLEDGIEVGGGVFPTDILDGIDWAYENALDDGVEWVRAKSQLGDSAAGGDGVKGTVE